MSDSDDTDILLLIPPNFFIPTTTPDKQLNEYSSEEFLASMSNSKWDPEPPPAPSGSYKFLPPNQQIELDNINARLSNLETNYSPSDLSTISHCTGHNGDGRRYRNTLPRSNALIHSTPKDQSLGTVKSREEYNGVLKEIDHFLEDRKYSTMWNGNNDPMMAIRDEEQVMSLPNQLSGNKVCEDAVRTLPTRDSNLVSLSEMWGKNAPDNLTLTEERYRRMHLEKTIRSLQGKLLEYQQKISVAIEVDRTKDNALKSAQEETSHLNQELRRLSDVLSKLENDHRDLGSKYEVTQKELAQALGMAARFQDKNEKLENELESFSRKTTECSSLYKMQIEELEVKLHASKKSEEFTHTELMKVKDRLAKAEYQSEKTSTRCEDLEKQLETLRHHKEQAQELMQKQRNRADLLEDQKKSLNEKLTALTEKETALEKKLEMQRQSMKLHYQQQLENVVTQKLKEFQEQLDKVEETLKKEAHDRERLIAERAIKQMELINEKNEQELSLLHEKHDEEVELYRIQLANASKKIDELETKLNSYKTRRADLAEKLHNVMEAQWQKALEILTSPNSNAFESKSVSMDNLQSTAENEQFQTPKSSRQNQVAESFPHADRLQAYIELLLSKSPQDIENLDELLSMAKSRPSTSGAKSKPQLRSGNGKPPWKG